MEFRVLEQKLGDRWILHEDIENKKVSVHTELKKTLTNGLNFESSTAVILVTVIGT